jgi:hypothetical protein
MMQLQTPVFSLRGKDENKMLRSFARTSSGKKIDGGTRKRRFHGLEFKVKTGMEALRRKRPITGIGRKT